MIEAQEVLRILVDNSWLSRAAKTHGLCVRFKIENMADRCLSDLNVNYGHGDIKKKL
jgi:hypothetical protein